MKLRRHVIFSILIFILAINIGVFAYHNVEKWSYLNSLYFVVITVTSIGYGDLVPVTTAGKIFTMFYAFLGVGMALYILSTIGGAIFKKHVSEKVSEIKREVKKQEEVKEEIHSQLEDFILDKLSKIRKKK